MKDIIPALITPFDKDMNVDYSVLRRLVRWNLQQGATGFYVCGSSGEFLALSLNERKRIVETVREEADSQMVICHVGAVRFADAVELAQHAERAGVDYISTIPPIYYQYGEREIQDYFRAIASSVSIPCIVYNVPAFAKTNLSVSFFADLLRDSCFGGIKFTSYDLFGFERIIQNCNGKKIFIGHDEIFLPALCLGASGGIGSTFNFMASKFSSIASCLEENRMEEARKVQADVNAIVEVLLAVGIFPGIKQILKELGFDCGSCRKPFNELSEEAVAKLKEGILPLL